MNVLLLLVNCILGWIAFNVDAESYTKLRPGYTLSNAYISANSHASMSVSGNFARCALVCDIDSSCVAFHIQNSPRSCHFFRTTPSVSDINIVSVGDCVYWKRGKI